MAVNHIPIDTTKRLGNRLRRCRDLGQEFVVLLRECKAIMDAQVDAGSYTAVESEFGLPATKGDEAYNLVAGVLGKIDVNTAQSNTRDTIQQMLDWLG